MEVDVGSELLALAGGDVFVDVRQRSEARQRRHDCGRHNARGPQMHLVASLARLVAPTPIVDLGCGLVTPRPAADYEQGWDHVLRAFAAAESATGS